MRDAALNVAAAADVDITADDVAVDVGVDEAAVACDMFLVFY